MTHNDYQGAMRLLCLSKVFMEVHRYLENMATNA